MASIVVEPKDSAAPAPEVQSTSGEPAALPEEVVQIPAIQALLAGSPPAVSVPVTQFEKMPESKVITKYKEPLMQAGLAFYRSLSGDLGAIFNRMFVTDQQILEADKAGKLATIAPPISQVTQEIATSGTKNPALNAATPESAPSPAAPSITPASVLPPQPQTQPASPKAQAKALTEKVKNLAVGSPTSGPKPGSGRILNNILKPVL